MMMISSWAFFLSILIYISIFYIFNLSPSTLLNTTRFWFFISNTLILIIAVDFGAFSSSNKHRLDLPEELSKISSTCRRHPPKTLEQHVQYQKIDDNDNNNKLTDVVEVVLRDETKPGTNKPQDSADTSCFQEKQQEEFTPAIVNEEKKSGRPRLVRSNSEKVSSNDDEKRIVLHRSHTEKLEPVPVPEPEIEENEFTSMSDEELNRRVEEFIQRFNRQIRLQAAATNLESSTTF